MTRPAKPVRAVAKRTIKITTAARRDPAGDATRQTVKATSKRPMITVNVVENESMLLIVVPGYSRIALATAYSLMSRILFACEDSWFAWVDSYRIGPGDRLKTCTSVELQVIHDGSTSDRVRHLGEHVAFPAIRSLISRDSTYDAMLVVHRGSLG